MVRLSQNSVVSLSTRRVSPGSPSGGGDTRRGGSAPLGKNTKSQATSRLINNLESLSLDGPLLPLGDGLFDSGSGEVLTGDESRVILHRVGKYALQSVVKSLMPDSRTAWCMRHVRFGKESVDVFKHKAGTCHYGNLAVCGSVWVCPVCSAKVSEGRRRELADLVLRHRDAGQRDVSLVTYTFSHSRFDDLGFLLSGLSKAVSWMKSQRAYKRLVGFVGQVGTVRSLEVTHGLNGWHPHIHELWFVDEGHDQSWLSDSLFDIWRRAVIRQGLGEPTRQFGVDVRGGAVAAHYVAKYGEDYWLDGPWNLTHEVTKSQLKHGGGVKSRTPFDLLRSFAFDSDIYAGTLFVQFARAFRGSRQLVYSRGLRKLYPGRDMTDEEIAQQTDHDSYLLGSLTIETWKKVLRDSGRARLLELAARGGWPAVCAYLSTL